MRAGTATPTGDGAQGWEQNTGQGWSRANFGQGGESAADLNRQQQARSAGAARETSFHRSGGGFSPVGGRWAGSGARAGRRGGTAAPARWHGDRELDAADLLLSELHLGATYDAIVRRRLWRRMPLDVVATYALVWNGGGLLVTTAVLWHPACVGAGRCGRRG
jgi:hypothetical protein